jgi:hypothetical protein
MGVAGGEMGIGEGTGGGKMEIGKREMGKGKRVVAGGYINDNRRRARKRANGKR